MQKADLVYLFMQKKKTELSLFICAKNSSNYNCYRFDLLF